MGTGLGQGLQGERPDRKTASLSWWMDLASWDSVKEPQEGHCNFLAETTRKALKELSGFERIEAAEKR